MNILKAFVITAAVTGLAASAHASEQESTQGPVSTTLPGSVNFTSGTISPAEPGNRISSAVLDQGVTIWRRGSLFGVAYAAVTLRDDTAGLVWNHGTTLGAGARLVAVSGSQVLQASVGVAGEPAARGAVSVAPTLTATLSYWAGWTGRHTTRPNTPGSTWVASGILTPREPGNWITAGALDQGIQVWRYRSVNLIAFAGATASVDTLGHDWNNRMTGEAGFKIARPIRGGVVDLRLTDRHERRWQSRTNQSGPSISVNLWLGWNPNVFRR